LSEDNLLWVEKYRPKKIADIIGNEEAKTAFVDWLKNKRHTKKAVLLYGPPGVGKTTLVNAAAAEFGFKVIEMNASDTRSEKAINAIAGPATSFVALDTFSTEIKGSILFLDEVDGIAGNEDRGGYYQNCGKHTHTYCYGSQRPRLRQVAPAQKSLCAHPLSASAYSAHNCGFAEDLPKRRGQSQL
jgi:DNA polymerase III delta prime subunit